MTERASHRQFPQTMTATHGDAAAIDSWSLAQTSFDAALAARDASLFALANGTLGVRAGFEEMRSASDGTYLAEVYERTPIHYHERHSGFARSSDTRVPVADATHIAIRLGDETVDLTAGTWLAFERRLDLRGGHTTRRLRWRSPRGATLEITAERFVPLDQGAVSALRFRVISIDYDGAISLDSTIDGAGRSAGQSDDPRIGAGAGIRMALRDLAAAPAQASLVQATQTSATAIACVQRHRIADGVLAFDAAAVDADRETAHQTYAATLAPGTSITLEKYVAYAWTREASEQDADLLQGAGAQLDRIMADGFDALLERQRTVLATFWRDADLAIDGDPAQEQALRFNLFHLYQSTGRGGRTSTAAKGLTGEGYEGHYFWDTEAFVLPVLALTEPILARGMLAYRIGTLDRARAHARELNHARGALYAWRTIGGDESSAYYPGGSAQYHINADIAYALELYVESSEDHALLLDGGAELVFETARVWPAIGHFSERRDGAFCIHEVTGPDEYTALVDNNWYTNRMAQRHLRYAVAVARYLRAEHANPYAALATRIGLDDAEIAIWSRAADAMYLPVDDALGVLPQNDGFLDKPVWDFAGTPDDRYPLLLHYHPLTIYRHQVCKQADVVLALVLAGDGIERDAKRRNFDYYERITVHDSTLSPSTFSVLASEVGYADKAYAYFLDTTRVDLDDLHGNTDHGVHMAAMAGSWLSLVWGFAGLRIAQGRLSFAPTLPAAWRGYRFGLVWRGRRLRIEVGAERVVYTLVEGAPLAITHAQSERLLVPGAPTIVALSAQSAIFPRRFRALIADLDGVIVDTAVEHYRAWKRLADEIGVPFDEVANERLKGVDRRASLDLILERATRPFGEAERVELADRKNGYYRAQIATIGPDALLPGARETLLAARAAGLRTALASASRNAAEVIARLGIADLFDYVADAATISRAKPDPEIFLDCARALAVAQSECLGLEDAAAGVAAIKAAGMHAIGIGDATTLAAADAVLPSLANFRIERFVTT